MNMYGYFQKILPIEFLFGKYVFDYYANKNRSDFCLISRRIDFKSFCDRCYRENKGINNKYSNEAVKH